MVLRQLLRAGTVLLLCLSVVLVSSNPVSQEEEGKKSYRNYKVVRTQPLENQDIIPRLWEFDGLEGISFWKYPSLNQSVDIMASPEKLASVEKTLSELGLEHVTVVEDVEKLFENQNDIPFIEKYSLNTMSWDRYHRYDMIMSYAKNQAARDEMVSYQSIGNSTEGRELGLVKISSGGENKPAIFMDGGVHAREWISPATVTYIMHNLITNDNYSDLVEKFDWYIVPVINPDGYEYTHSKDRMWVKTRSPNSGNNCYGTDPNRNWGFQWGGRGTSRYPCSDVYHGPRAFSEPETAAVADAILARRYARQKPDDYQDLYKLAYIGTKALSATYGTRYRVGSLPDISFAAAGGSDDWAKASAGIKYSYTVELRDTGTYGFALPASQIAQTGEETLRGVAAVARSLHETLETQAVGDNMN